ncbi:superoxide dismutase [Mn], mitochondrial [Aspergillus sclerotioniger CBS 115572]|uniref:Superoxide dismutase n=1 Tax=Aspergillus sclerotioniger CBS 115572 TaxID=1450535 RepID=A0A317WQE4_9EURO|nr:superoxide dismutase [Mn], mitochondrial [Aspergillus sclerotioniger CBS 115572]PWY88649.1 superoxide dismutase [Mn], mitochondrial [Aspergillus sclerotioniger CBS 115572]
MAPIHTLPPLPYDYDALEPIISKEIMELHHKKHHQAYVTNLNAALAAEASALDSNDLTQIISIQQKLKFNGGGHINHSLFWKNLAPYDSPATKLDRSAPTLKAAIEKQWGSVKKFTDAFEAVLLGIQGSGWGWLVSKEKKGYLELETTKDQDPVMDSIPVFGVDMWEHAYYLQYLNNKASYAQNIWKVINWEEAEHRYVHGVEDSIDLKL